MSAARALLFDLDGTLLDTADDIATALGRAFAERDLKAPDEPSVRAMIGKGAPTLVSRALAAVGVGPDAALAADLVEGFSRHYGGLQEAGECRAQPYPGVREALQALEKAGLRLAVVTNKQQRFAAGLLARRGLARHFQVVVGGDTCERRKPDPQPLLHACGVLGVAPSAAVMVGDSVNDVQAARGAGMRVWCVPYGYNEGQDPRQLACDALVHSLEDLLPLLGLRA